MTHKNDEELYAMENTGKENRKVTSFVALF